MSDPNFTFQVISPKKKERERTFQRLIASDTPYGEITVEIGNYPRRTTVLCEALPRAELEHPDYTRDPEDGIPIDDSTRLIVGDQPAQLTQNRRALNRADRAVRIQLGERSYRYTCPGKGADELHDTTRGLLVRFTSHDRKTITATMLDGADTSDLALALVLRGIDHSTLSLTSTIVIGGLRWLQSGGGEA